MGLDQKFIPLSERKNWDAALENLPHSFAYTHAYNAAIAGDNADRTFLYAGEAKNFRIVCPLAVRSFEGYDDIVSPYGFSGFAWRGEYPGWTDEFKRFAAAQNYVAGYIVQHPLTDLYALASKDDLFFGKHCFLLDLKPSANALLANMASDHRSRLRQWWKQQPQVITDKSLLTAPFMKMYPEAMARAGAKESYFFSETTLRLLIGSPQTLLIGVEAAGVIEAVSMFLYDGSYAEYYLNACTENGRRHARGLVWHAAQQLKERGVMTLNLGCGISEGDALEEFKQRFGGKPTRFGILKQIYRPAEYAALCQERSVDAADKSGYFPAYRSKQ